MAGTLLMAGSVCGKSDAPKPLIALFKPSNTQTRDNDSYHCIQRLLDPVANVVGVTGQEVSKGVLLEKGFKCFIVGAGLAPSHAQEMRKKVGQKRVEEFLNKGGGYIGICAGAYLVMGPQSWWTWNLIPCNIIDLEHWERGVATAKVKICPQGRQVLRSASYEPPPLPVSCQSANDGPPPPPPPPPPALDVNIIEMRYVNGPLMEAKKPCVVLATFASEVRKLESAPPCVMLNTPAIVSGQMGAGRVILFSAHPESSSSRGRSSLLDALNWVLHAQDTCE